jgi:hypothetical protein
MNNISNDINQMSRPVDSLLNNYLKQEGIDRRYSKLIAQELLDATEMTNDQLDMAAGELQSLSENPNGNLIQ